MFPVRPVLFTMYSVWLVLVHLSLCGYPVCLVSVTMLGSSYNFCVYQHVWMCGCCIIDPVLEVHPPCGVVCSWLVPALPSSFVYPVHVSGDHVYSVSDGGVHLGGVMGLVDSIM